MRDGEALTSRPGLRLDAGRTTLIGGSLFIVILLAGVAAIGWQLRVAALSDSRRSVDQLSVALAEQTARTLQAVDLVLQDAAHRIASAAAGSGSGADAVVASRETNDLLRDRLRSVPQADALAVVDAQGRVANVTRAFPTPTVDAADRDFFAALKDGTAAEPYFSAPVRSRLNGAWTVFVARRLAWPDRAGGVEGAFHGLVLAAVSIDYIEAFYQAVTTKPGSAAALVRDDGLMLARFPHDDSLIGHVVPPRDGAEALVSVHKLPLQPLSVEVSLTRSAALASWRRQTWAVAAFSLLAAACMLLMLRTIARQFKAQHAAQLSLAGRNAELETARMLLEGQAKELADTAAALRGKERQLAERSAVLNTTLENIDQGLLMVNGAGMVASYNHRVVEMLGLPEELLARRPAFRDVLEYQWQSGEFARTGETVREFARAGGIASRPTTYERERPDGRTIEVTSLPLPDGGMVRTYSDVTERKAAEARIQQIAMFDDLTGLPNRIQLHQELVELLRDHPGPDELVLLSLDLDRFRLINDARGHTVGDKLLIEAGRRIQAAIDPADRLARIGGDEFTVVHIGADGPALAQALVARLAEPFVFNGRRLAVTVSIGIARAEPGVTAETLRRNADLALYRAKDAGRNTYRVYEPAMAATQREQFLVEQSLREALGKDEFQLAYQPVVSLEGNRVVGYEALLRWTDRVRGAVSPQYFVPVAEATGLIVPLGRWVLERACHEAASWGNACTVAVNLSPVQLRQGDLLQVVEGVLSRSGLSPERLELEVTEGVLLEDSGTVLETMMALRGAGVALTLDDFGTGHASLSYLRRFPFDKIKIDRSFIRNLGHDRQSEAIVEAILLMGRRLGLQVVAEGVEDEAQLEHLRSLRCPLVQGFFTGRPMSAEMARAL